MKKTVLAVIGGGRWGQVYLSILKEMSLPCDHLIVVSQANATMLQQEMPWVECLPTVAALLNQYQVKAAIIANAAKDHVSTAHLLLDQSIPLLIEKPLALNLSEAKQLIAKAQAKKVALIPGLNFRFSSYIDHFAKKIHHKGLPNKFTLHWIDVQNEIRHGRVKKHDLSITVIQDVMPHVWTILTTVFPKQTFNLHTSASSILQATIKLTNKQLHGEIFLNRAGEARSRVLTADYITEKISLDFTNEPGEISLAAKKICADSEWQQKPGPLTLQLQHFFSAIEKQPNNLDLEYGLGSVSFTEVTNQDVPTSSNRMCYEQHYSAIK